MAMFTRRNYVTVSTAVIMLLVAMFTIDFVSVSPSQSADPIPISPIQPVTNTTSKPSNQTESEAAYIIYQLGNSTVVKNGNTSSVDFKSEKANEAIQYAIDHASMISGTILIKPGYYLCSADTERTWFPVHATSYSIGLRSNIHVMMEQGAILAMGGNMHGSLFSNATEGVHDVSIVGGEIDGRWDYQQGYGFSWNRAFELWSVSNMTVDGLYIHDVYGEAIYIAKYSSHITVQNTRIENVNCGIMPSAYPDGLTGMVNNISVLNNYITRWGWSGCGVYAHTGVRDIQISENTFVASYQNNDDLAISVAWNVQRVTITDNYVYSEPGFAAPGRAGIGISMEPETASIWSDDWVAEDGIIKGNIIENGFIMIYGLRNGSILGNTLLNSTIMVRESYNITVSENDAGAISNNHGDFIFGIGVYDRSSEVTVEGNNLHDLSKRGIWIHDAERVTISSNRIGGVSHNNDEMVVCIDIARAERVVIVDNVMFAGDQPAGLALGIVLRDNARNITVSSNTYQNIVFPVSVVIGIPGLQGDHTILVPISGRTSAPAYTYTFNGTMTSWRHAYNA